MEIKGKRLIISGKHNKKIKIILSCAIILLLILIIFLSFKLIQKTKENNEMFVSRYNQGMNDLVSAQTQRQSCLVVVNNQLVEVPIG